MMFRKKLWLLTVVPLVMALRYSAAAAPPRFEKPDRISVYPNSIELASRRDNRQLIVTGWFNGEKRDLTSKASITSNSPLVAIPSNSVVRAVGNGNCTVTAGYGGKTAAITVRVTGIERKDPVRFKFETLAALTKQGCSTGSCHGAPHGKGGFVLSLFGYSPAADRIALTRDGFSRRIDTVNPANSLIIKKPSLQLPHVGGKRLRKDDDAYALLVRWISEGAKAELPATECTDISVYPDSEQRLKPDSNTQQLSVIASYSDGSRRDVTRLAAFDTSNAAVVSAAPRGLVTGKDRGQAAISIRYLDKVQSVHFTMSVPVPGYKWTAIKEPTDIDRLVDERLRELKYLPSEICSDSVFVRRLYLDLTGLLPTADQARAFLLERSANKRERLVDSLLETEEYARFWALKRADLMRVTPARLKGDRAKKFSDWIVDSVRSNMPYDKYARTIITAVGSSDANPAVCYYVAIPTMEDRTEMTAQIFMGSRVECARCHNHPFENWTMKDYYSIGAVFARTNVANGVDVLITPTGETVNPNSGEVMKPFGMIRNAAGVDTSYDRRTAFADWLVKPGNPLFARVAVNRIWSALMGRGIVEPVDDFRSSNPPSNGPLLDWLAASFIKSGYDCKATIRQICGSYAYQRSTAATPHNSGEDTLFSHAKVRMLTAEQLKDALGSASHALPPPAAARDRYATESAYPTASAFMETFGQPERTSACTCERQSAPTLLQALELLNGSAAYSDSRAGSGFYAAMDDEKLIKELYLTALSREPSPSEMSAAKAFLAHKSSRADAVTDLIWTVLNTREFMFQH